MNVITLNKANNLMERISHLSSIKINLNPKLCNGIGIKSNSLDKYSYVYNLYEKTIDSNVDEVAIMKEGVQSMYNKTCELLEKAKKELEEL